MEAPLCFACNQRHWSTQPCPAWADVRAEQQKQIRQKLVAKAVTNNQPTVTKNTPAVTTNPISVTPKPISVTNFRDAPAPSQKRKRGRPPLGDKKLSAAERARRYRNRKRQLPTQKP
jgi:hypothetical protein